MSEGNTIQIQGQKTHSTPQLFFRHKHTLITSIAIIILGISIASLIGYGLKHNFNSACFITSAVLTPFAFGIGSFSIYLCIINNVKTHKEKIASAFDRESNAQSTESIEISNNERLLESEEESYEPEKIFEETYTCDKLENEAAVEPIVNERSYDAQDNESEETSNKESAIIPQTETKNLENNNNLSFGLISSDVQRKSLENSCDFFRREWSSTIPEEKNARRSSEIPENQRNKPKTQVNRSLAQLILAKKCKESLSGEGEVYICIHEPPSTGNDVAIQSQNQLRKRSTAKIGSYFPDLPLVISNCICNFLDIQEISNLALVNSKILYFTKSAELQRARQYGYSGNDVTEAKKYLQALPKLLSILKRNNVLLKEYLIYRKSQSSEDFVIHFEETFRKIRPSNESTDFFQTLLDKTLMHLIKQDNQLTCVELLLSFKANPNKQTDDGYTALHYAAKSLHLSSILLLLQHGAQINQQNARGSTPLCYILEERNSDYHTKNDHKDRIIDTVKVLIQAEADPNIGAIRGHFPLHCAVKHGYSEIVNLLLEHGARIDELDGEGNTALCYALRIDYFDSKNLIKEIVTILINKGANPNIPSGDGCPPLHLAAQRGYFEIVGLLLEHKARVNELDQQGNTALCSILGANNSIKREAKIKVTVRLLLMAHADPNKATATGNTPLHYASRLGYSEIVSYLLDHKAQVNTVDPRGYSPLLCALESIAFFPKPAIAIEEIVKALLKKGANPHFKEESGNTALHFAADKGYDEIVKVLLDYGSNINERNNEGDTPLLLASESGNARVVTLLLSSGANPTLLNHKEHSARDVAFSKEIQKLLPHI